MKKILLNISAFLLFLIILMLICPCWNDVFGDGIIYRITLIFNGAFCGYAAFNISLYIYKWLKKQFNIK